MNTVIRLLITFSQFFIGQISNSGQVIERIEKSPVRTQYVNSD